MKFKNILKQAADLFRPGKRNDISVPAGSLFFWMGYKAEVYPSFSSSLAKTAYLDNDAIFTIVNKDAKKFSSICRYIKDADGRKAPANKNYNGLRQLMQNPNKYQGQSLFFESARMSRTLYGEAIIWLNRGHGIYANAEMTEFVEDRIADKLPVLQMEVLPVQNVNPVSDGTPYGILYWVYHSVNKTIKLRKNDIIHWHNWNPDFDAGGFTHLRGISPLQPGRKLKTEYDEIQNSGVRMFKNDGSKKALLNKDTVGNPSDTQMQELRDIVHEGFNTNESKGKIATLAGSWEVLNLGGSSVDMDLLKARQLTMQNLCFMFDLPYEFWDSQTSFANKEQALIYWVTNVMMPACKQLDDELNRALCQAFGLVTPDGDYTAYIYSDVWELPEMQKYLQEKAKGLRENWMIAPNIILQELGYDKVENALFDEPFIPGNLIPLSELGDNGFNKQMDNLRKKGI